jgi:hypothetical protein
MINLGYGLAGLAYHVDNDEIGMVGFPLIVAADKHQL